MAADPDGVGYWFVAADGGVLAFDATFHGSAVGVVGSNDRVVGMSPHPAGGYFVATESGGLSRRVQRPVDRIHLFCGALATSRDDERPSGWITLATRSALRL